MHASLAETFLNFFALIRQMPLLLVHAYRLPPSGVCVLEANLFLPPHDELRCSAEAQKDFIVLRYFASTWEEKPREFIALPDLHKYKR